MDDSGLLTAIVLLLRPISECLRLPESHGGFAHSAARDGILLRLAPRLYEAAGKADPTHLLKPFTVSPLCGDWECDRQNHEVWLSPERVYGWRLTGLDTAASECLRQVAPKLGPIRMGSVIFQIEAVLWDPQMEHPLAQDSGADTYDELETWWAEAEPPATVALEFRTPTAFSRSYSLPGSRKREYEMPFPLPRQVFGNLAERWAAHHGGPPRELTTLIGAADACRPEAVRSFFDQAVIPGRWQGETQRVDLRPWSKHQAAHPGGRKDQDARQKTGFVGRCQYRPYERHAGLQRLLGLLADFAFYAGIGIETGNGMGQTRLVEW